MGSTRNHSKKVNPQHSRRSRSQRLRRIREKCERELVLAAQSILTEPVHNQNIEESRPRKRVNKSINELHTFSEIIIPTSEEAESVLQDGNSHFLPSTIKFTNVICRPSPLSTPLLDSKISSYINCQSKLQSNAGDPPPGLQAACDNVIVGNPLPPERAMFDANSVIEQRREVKAHNHAYSFGGKLMFDGMVGEGHRYVCSKRKCDETSILKVEREKYKKSTDVRCIE